ncbi:hypothetical protein RHGRI_025879 [Rhododendron griersonianum]|nr:hypothetical protein RHGRI_025879 [Rhododendron griersonianum]
MEEDFWALKSRVNWLCDGDRNTRFFHLTTLNHRHNNKIRSLKDPNGVWLYDADLIQQTLTSHFISLFTTDMICSKPVSDPPFLFPRIEMECHQSLCSVPAVDEIKKVLWSFKPWKSPGPDGLHPGFFQKTWDIVAPSVVQVIEEAFSVGRIPPGLNHTYLCLIPKIRNPETVGHLRLISLCNTILKLVTKILISRIRPLLCDLISPLQSSFLPGRSSTDNVIIVQEIVHRFNSMKGSKGNMLIKLDLEKAYDRLEWGFIRQVLHFFNFPPLWINLIMSIISLSSMSILFNGSATDTFSPSRGIRQGDPLSPYIFILCVEYLSIQITLV